MTDVSSPVLRAASAADAEAIATLWHDGWRDGHLGNVPEGLLEHRRLESFRERVPPRLATTTVAVLGARLVGFVTVKDDEVENIYVARDARGTGAATLLLNRGEAVIAARYERAWLAVATGNARARRFYAREGWIDSAGIDYPAETAGGTFVVPCRRYEKHLGVRAGERAGVSEDR